MCDDILDNTIKIIENYYFGQSGECGEKLFIDFAAKHKSKFAASKLSNSTENQFM